MTLTLNFQGQILNLLNLGQKWTNCHKTKSKHIDWTLSLKCDRWIWPWPWPWSWIFKVKYAICYISAKNVRLSQNKKQKYWLNSMPQMWPSDLTFTMTLTLNLQGQIWNLLYLSQKWFDCHKMKSSHIDWPVGLNDHKVWPWRWPWKVRCKDLPDSDQGDFRCQHAIHLSSFS